MYSPFWAKRVIRENRAIILPKPSRMQGRFVKKWLRFFELARKYRQMDGGTVYQVAKHTDYGEGVFA